MAKKSDSLDKKIGKLTSQKDIRAVIAKAERLSKLDLKEGSKARLDVINTLRDMGKSGKHF